jgi:hypothetical protein
MLAFKIIMLVLLMVDCVAHFIRLMNVRVTDTTDDLTRFFLRAYLDINMFVFISIYFN